MEVARDAEGFLCDLGDWSEKVAEQTARMEGIELSEAHWQVIWLLRQRYSETEHQPANRALVTLVKRELGDALGNSIALLGLFPGSPAKLAAKIAGLPKPPGCL